MDQLEKCSANYVPLSPITFLKRAASAYPDRTSIVYGRTHFSWMQTYERCCRLASSIRSLHISKNYVVSVLAPNVPAMYEMHFAVPMAGAVLNPINTRLDASTIAIHLRHSEAKLFFVDWEFIKVASDAINILVASGGPTSVSPLVVVIDDIDNPTGARLGELEYEDLIRRGDPDAEPHHITDEWDPITLNYTSGTTSAPKGVVYSHRGAYLNTLALLLQWGVGSEPVYLWSLPMFHCNGWTFTWGLAAQGGVNVCIRKTSAADIYSAIIAHGVTHMCCVPAVFDMLIEGSRMHVGPLLSQVHVLTGGAPPPASLLEHVENMGFKVSHAYGMTEATGAALICEWQAHWDLLPADERARLKARQGVSMLSLADVDVKKLNSTDCVPRDGNTMGEIVLRGSNIMKGYLKNPEATAKAFEGGWFSTGDAGVIHPDGYIEIKDRLKDVIISGGENISSVEVETVLHQHPAVSQAAVVAMPHPKWGESPCAFIVLKGDRMENIVKEEDIIAYCQKNMPRFMAPKKVVFKDELPMTNKKTVIKSELRKIAKGFTAVLEQKSNDVREHLPEWLSTMSKL
ncbi:CoA ligase [Rhynchospora pubera]|uniref:4-coumarate--CoA ligase n=1 Tax=Rhynchospora pubera TaxID=906938 RepID=A0AAV8E9T2_9POAL|nr:CoA ligase [Rhynchospora pubera]